MHEVEELFLDPDAAEDQLDFPIVFTNARAGTVSTVRTEPGRDLRPLMDLLVEVVVGQSGEGAHGGAFWRAARRGRV